MFLIEYNDVRERGNVVYFLNFLKISLNYVFKKSFHAIYLHDYIIKYHYL